MNGDVRKVLRMARKAGWEIIEKKDGHQLRSLCGLQLFHLHSNHSGFAVKNVRKLQAQLRKFGFITQ